MELFEIKNLSFCYPNSKSLVLNNINIKVNTSDFILICGESGCGKTTLLRHFKEELTPFGAVKGEVINKDCSVGFVMQDPENQIVTDKVWSELAFGLENMGMKGEEIRLRCGEIATFFGISSWYHKRTNELSGGQKQLLNLAGVLAMKPDIIVLDEPLSQLDPLASTEFINALVRINKELGISIVISEHNLDEVLPIAKRVIVMDKGSIIIENKANSIMEFLKNKNHIMQSAMPASVRIHSALEGVGKSPLTVGEGKKWLKEIADKKYSVKLPSEKQGDIVIRGKELFFAYEKDNDIIRNMNIEVRAGEIFAVLGSNGSGKTTGLRLLAGINNCYYGKLEIKGKVAMLPQNPIALFTEKSVLLDLKMTGKKIGRAVELLEIGDLLGQNPNDLSGGELQRCAIAKVILTEPDILLLDEPTKGIDAFMKKKLGKIIRGLGITVVMVSHDIEFCAEFADRCTMFFDGQIVNCCESHKFFADNFFYTTGARKIAEGVVDNAITTEEVISVFGKYEKIEPSTKTMALPNGLTNIREEKINENYKIRTILSAFIILLLIPLVIWGGMRFFDDRKYYVVSFAIIVLAMTPFFMLFESKRARAREIVIVASMCVICVAGRIVFAPFPQIKPVCALVIISGICLGSESGFIIGALSGFCSNLYFGQGPWTPWQMFAFGIIGLLAGFVRKFIVNDKNEPNKFKLAIFGFFAVLIIYGFIMNSATVFMYQPEPNLALILAACGTGLIFDMVHAVSTVVFLCVFSKTMCEKIIRVKKKFGLL